MSTLQENLDAIKLDKDTNLKPENLKKDVTCLGVTGTYEGSGGGTVEGIKQFSTIEEMNNSTGNNEGDLAVVYRSEIQNATVDSKFQVATFPETVVLDTALTDSVEVRYRAVDSSKMFDCMGSLDSSMFEMDCFTESGQIRIQYESSDGITYTRTDTIGNPVDFGTEIYYEYAEMWNDAIGKFIQIGGMVFDGLFKYGAYTDVERFKPVMRDSIALEGTSATWNGEYNDTIVEKDKLLSIARSIMADIGSGWTKSIYACIKDGKWNVFVPQTQYESSGSMSISCITCLNNDGILNPVGIGGNQAHTTSGETMTKPPRRFEVDLENQTYVDKGIVSVVEYQGETYYFSYADFIPDSIMYEIVLSSNRIRKGPNIIVYLDTTSHFIDSLSYEDNYTFDKYNLAPTQLTATSDYVYGKEFYGKNGVEIGTLQNKENLTKDEVKHKVDIWSNYNSGIVCPNDASYMFRECTNLTTIPLLDTSSVTTMLQMFFGCKNLTTIPLLDTSSVTSMKNMFSDCTNLTEIPQLDTSSVADMRYMFKSCTNLTTIPLLDTSSVTNMQYMFEGCTSLSDESLNNILAMCKNATSYTGTKTLKYIGLTSAQATKCTTLSNYSAFTSAGWTTGY